MHIFLKLAWRNIKRKKLRYLLVVATFFLSAVTLVAAVLFKDAAIQSRLESLRNQTLNSQLSVFSKDADRPFFDAKKAMESLKGAKGIEQISVRLGAGAALAGRDDHPLSVIGIDYEEQKKVYPFALNQSGKLEPFVRKAIIGQKTAEALKLAIGSTMNLAYNGKTIEFQVAGIADDKGVFQYEGMVFIPLLDARALFGGDRQATSLGITLTDLKDINEVKDVVTAKLDGSLKVQQNYDLDYYRSFVGTLDMAITVFALFAIFITLFLSYSTFKTLLMERISQIGTLKSVGASRVQVLWGLILENLFIVMGSSLLGIVAGVPLTRWFLRLAADGTGALPPHYGKVTFLFAGLTVAGLFSILSAVRRIAALPVVGILKGNMDRQGRKVHLAKPVIGLLLLSCSAGGMLFHDETRWGVAVLSASLIALVLSFVLLLPWLHRGWLALLSPLLSRFGPSVRLVVKGLKRDFLRSAESLVLIALVIAMAYVSFVTSLLVKQSASGVYQTMDVYLTSSGTHGELGSTLLQNKSVAEVVTQYRTARSLNGVQVEIAGVDPSAYGKVSFEKFTSRNSADAFAELNQGRTIIVTTTFAKAAHKQLGDELILKTGDRSFSYKIAGICSSFENMGKVLFISKENYLRDIKGSGYVLYLVKSAAGYSAEQTTAQIKSHLKEEDYDTLTSIPEMLKENTAQNNKLFLVVNLLFALSAGVSVMCLNNNLILSFLTRKRSFAVQKTVGLSQRQMFGLTFEEAVLLSLEGGVFGILLGFAMNFYLARILSYYIGDLSVSFQTPLAALLLLAAVIIGLLSALVPYRNLSRMDVIQSIKGME